MKITQIYELMNTTVQEVLGTETIVNEDLSNIVDIGNEIISTENVDNYVKKLVNHIGKVVFSDRVYTGSAPTVLMDSWEFGSILEKVTAELPTATENESWKLVDGQEYSPDIFYEPKVSAKFYNSKITFEIPLSFTELQVKESFSSQNQLNGFLSMLYNSVDKAMTVKLDGLVMKTINNMIAETVNADLYDGETLDLTTGSIKAVNLLAEYTAKTGNTVTVDKALTDPDFIRFASYTINVYKDRLTKLSTLFNVGGKERFTTSDYLHVVLLSNFASSTDIYLNSDVQHNELVKLPNFETVPYWQGSGLAYDFDDITSIDVKTQSGAVVKMSGILGVMFDRESLGVANLDRRVTTNYNPKAEFYTNFYKLDAGYYNDLNENFVVFYVA